MRTSTSINRWAQCPRCLASGRQRHEAESQAVQAAYGQVPALEYQRLLRQLEQSRLALEHSREPHLARLCQDFEAGMDQDGRFQIRYNCQCRSCGFAHDFQYEAIVPIEEVKK